MDQFPVPRDEIYSEAQHRFSLVATAVRYARRRMFRDFMHMTKASSSDTILDIGVSDVITDEVNFLEQQYPYRANVTCVGLSDGAGILAAYPGISYRKIEPNTPLPFPDKAFTIATCNAVLEHVGSDQQRRALISEMLRVADRVFIAIPNRWFPIEHHTATLFLHYWPTVFRAFCRLRRKKFWADPMNLEFLSRSRLIHFFLEGVQIEFRYSDLLFGPLSSNLVCVARRC